MPIELWFAFVIASGILLIIPGPTILTVISYSVAHGRRANAPLVAAVALGDSTALVLSLLGLGALLATSAFWFTMVKGIGGLYLLYLGVKLLRAGISSRGVGRPGCARIPVAAFRKHLSGYGPQSQEHRVLRGLPAAVHQPERRCCSAALGSRGHLRRHGHDQCRDVRRIRRLGAQVPVVASGAAAF